MRFDNIAFVSSGSPAAVEALAALTALHGQCAPFAADVVVALGGDGFMLQTLHETQAKGVPVYGMNCGTIGFLMNAYSLEDLPARLEAAEEATINPLVMRAETLDGQRSEALAINEVALLRAGAQAAKLRISIDGQIMGGQHPVIQRTHHLHIQEQLFARHHIGAHHHGLHIVRGADVLDFAR